MREIRPLLSFFSLFVLALPVLPQQTPSSATSVQRDAKAITLLQQAVASMAPVPPGDSSATGSVTLTEGSLITEGTVTILTKGNAETSIQFQTPNNPRTIIFANGQAAKIDASQTTGFSLELSASSQCLYFPLPYLLSVLSNPDYSSQYIGQEKLETSVANHIVVQNTYNSSPTYQFLAPFTTADIWFDVTSGLPVKIRMVRRDGGGSSDRTPISFTYSNYQLVAGVQYPFIINEFYTDTLWATTRIQTVSFNTGLADASFAVSAGVN